MADILPDDKRRWRACLLCSLVKTQAQFKRDGCDNCEEVLRFKGNMERVMMCTSGQYDGLVAMMRPDASWVARWQRVDKFHKGLYAVRVTGRLPQDIEDDLARRSLKYRPRDGSVKD
ncbi:transcription elongation factor spt4 [Polyrhizophydium stewartii]|uniref:Transcription elongation factor SPT4 n=1 Tax=Polyrhizophydium stewartii TaxID=2732419 RepID=A0ABR4N965_9FUNG